MASSAPVTKELFGKTSDGKDVYSFTLTAGAVTVRVLNFGCVVKDILVPDKDGKVKDISLGFDNFSDYEANSAFMGSICGRVANRIDGGVFSLDGVKYEVSKNDPLANNYCHGGFIGFTKRYFDWSIDGSKLILTYLDPDRTEGFPGNVSTTVTYELTKEDGLMIDYKATTDKPTPVDLANHFSVNLRGHSAGSNKDHVVTINSSEYLVLNERYIPTGKTARVDGTLLDMRSPTLLGDVLDKIPGGVGMHHVSVLPGNIGEKKLAARVDHPESKRYMEVYTTEPVVVNYGGYFYDLLLKGAKCKEGAVYDKNCAVLFFVQGYPDAVNHDNFPSAILRPGETYHRTSWYKFGVSE